MYFPNLNGLRFIAAALVLVSHVEETKFAFGLRKEQGFLTMPVYTRMGELAVTFFFVLSGMLITYLLLKERETSQISVKKFYVRRVLRIFPLYYLLVFLGFVIFPLISQMYFPGLTEAFGKNLQIKATLYLLLVPNVANVLMSPVPGISHLWSIGVEEQFYFIWPFIKKHFPGWKSSLLVIMGYWVVRLLVHFLLYYSGDQNKWLTAAENLILLTRIDCMAIGSFAAYLLLYNRKVVQYLGNPFLQYIVVTVTVLFMITGVNFGFFTHQVYALLFFYIIINAAGNARNVIRLENRIFRYLGKISYGIYMFHLAIVLVVFNILKAYLADDSRVSLPVNIAVYLIIFLLTIGAATISYETFEKYFLNLKKRFTVVSTKN